MSLSKDKYFGKCQNSIKKNNSKPQTIHKFASKAQQITNLFSFVFEMKKNIFIYSILLFGLFFSNCKKREIQNINKIRKVIVGKWNWIETRITNQQTTGAGVKKTPASEERTQEYHFSENGILSIFDNDTLSNSYHYRVLDPDIIRNEEAQDIWLEITDIQTDTLVHLSALIRISKINLFIDRELNLIVETFEKID